MNLIDKSYLHPVLRPQYDDITGKFLFDITDKVNIGAGNYIIDIDAVLENDTIEKLIAEGKAQICVFIYCKANFYRKAWKINSFSERITIPTEQLSGLVSLTIVISATTELKYQNSTQHPDYANQKFDITRGDILAISETCTFYAEKEFDSLQKMESIISITIDKNLKKEDPLKLNWESDKIKVSIATDIYREYCSLTKRLFPQAINSLIFLPILISIIHEWRNQKGEYEEDNKQFRWFRAIHARAENLNIVDNIKNGPESPFVLAQKLYDAPITRSLDEITKKWSDTETGDMQ